MDPKLILAAAIRCQNYGGIEHVLFAANASLEFAYCLGNASTPFALTRAPPQRSLRIKAFDFARVFSDAAASSAPLELAHWSGERRVRHNFLMAALPASFKLGGRVYVEYQLWQMPVVAAGHQLRAHGLRRALLRLALQQVVPTARAKKE